MRSIHTMVVAAVLALAASVQPAAASFAVALVTHERIVVASDSRTWDLRCDCSGGDTARKVDVRGAYAFLMTGDPSAFAAWVRTTPRPGESARDLTRRILDAVAPDTTPQELAIGVVSFGSDIYVAKATIHPDGRVEVLEEATPQPPVVFTLGWDDNNEGRDPAVNQVYAALQASPDEARMIEMATALQTAAAQSSIKVGGPQHVAIVDAAGSRWHTPHTDRDLHWDGTQLTIVAGPFRVDDNGIRINPSTTGAYITDNGFSFLTSDGLTTGPLGTYGIDSAALRAVSLQSLWTGGSAPATMQSQLLTQANDTRVGVLAQIGGGETALFLESTAGGVVGAGDIDIVGIPDFRGATSPTAGALVGYINVKVGGVALRIPVHNP